MTSEPATKLIAQLVAFQIYICFSLSFSFGQNTLGTVLNTNESLNGYTLISMRGGKATYLINNCGEIVNQWNSDFKLGTACYLSSEGALIRTAMLKDSVHIKISGGYRYLEKFNWEGDLLWRGDFDNPNLVPHHDIELLSNGNILMTFWEKMSLEESQAAGRVDSFPTYSTIFREIRPFGMIDYEVIWEWRMWDHLVQDKDSSKPNYGIVKEHPERININYKILNAANLPIQFKKNQFHINSVAYNERLDQILFSSRQRSEIYIIDHSTSTQEAKGSTGGEQGKGGDILWRFGNPHGHNQGLIQERVLFAQHDAQWIPDDYPFEGNILLFNNGYLRPIPVKKWYSEILIIEPSVNKEGRYPMNQDNRLDSEKVVFSYGKTEGSFFSRAMSGVQPLSNGNYLISSSRKSRVLEINQQKEIVWDYMVPLQGDNEVDKIEDLAYWGMFKTRRYPTDFIGFTGRKMQPIRKLGLVRNEDVPCEIFSKIRLEYYSDFNEKNRSNK